MLLVILKNELCMFVYTSLIIAILLNINQSKIQLYHIILEMSVKLHCLSVFEPYWAFLEINKFVCHSLSSLLYGI